MHLLALTLSTGQIEGSGIVGIAIVGAAVTVVGHMVKRMEYHVIGGLVLLAILGLAWMQHSSIQSSIKHCHPSFLGIHIQLSTAHQQQVCHDAMSQHPPKLSLPPLPSKTP